VNWGYEEDYCIPRHFFALGAGCSGGVVAILPSIATPANVKAEKLSQCCHLLFCVLLFSILHLADVQLILNNAEFMPDHRSQRHAQRQHFATLRRR